MTRFKISGSWPAVMKNKTITFKFKLPTPNPSLSKASQVLLDLGAITEALSIEDRFMVEHTSGRPENDAEHAHMLARIAPIIAIQMYPQLDPGLTALYSTIHDDVEAYVGDTPTHQYDKQLLEDKETKEKAATIRLLEDFAHIPAYTKLIKEYEDQKIPETRFVRVMDKLMPMIMHFNQEGADIRKHWSKEEFLKHSSAKTDRFRKDYSEYSDLLDLRSEMMKVAAEIFYS